jgi:hypothetical protein
LWPAAIITRTSDTAEMDFKNPKSREIYLRLSRISIAIGVVLAIVSVFCITQNLGSGWDIHIGSECDTRRRLDSRDDLCASMAPAGVPSGERSAVIQKPYPQGDPSAGIPTGAEALLISGGATAPLLNPPQIEAAGCYRKCHANHAEYRASRVR